jgi:hypothetical protein
MAGCFVNFVDVHKILDEVKLSMILHIFKGLWAWSKSLSNISLKDIIFLDFGKLWGIIIKLSYKVATMLSISCCNYFYLRYIVLWVSSFSNPYFAASISNHLNKRTFPIDHCFQIHVLLSRLLKGKIKKQKRLPNGSSSKLVTCPLVTLIYILRPGIQQNVCQNTKKKFRGK